MGLAKQKLGFIRHFSISVLILVIFLPTVTAQNNYQASITKGARVMRVLEYDEKKWEDCLGSNYKPEDYFYGDAAEINAKSKIAIRALYSSDWSVIDLLTTLPIISETYFPALLINYSQEELDEFPENYEIQYALYSQWTYTQEEFEIDPDLTNRMPFFNDPGDYKKWLDEFNEIITELSNPLLSQLAAEDLFFNLLLSGMGSPAPIGDYLKDLIEELDVEDANVEDNTITLQRDIEEKFDLEITYSSEGMIDHLVFKNSDGDIFYELQRSDDRWIIWTVFIGFVSFLIVAIAAIVLHRRRIKQR